MKNLFNNFFSFWEGVGRVRAAAHLARLGHHTAAQRLIAGD